MRVENDAIELMIRWAGGDHTPLRVKKNRVGQHRWTAGADVVELVTALARQLPDKAIAAIFNRAGKATGRGNGWNSIRASAGCAIIAGYRPIAMGLALSALFAPAANAQQQPTIFFCAAPAGHVCRFVVQTGATPIDFALLSGERSSSPALFRTRPSIVFVTPAL